MLQSLKIWGAGSDAVRCPWPAAPSDLPKSGGAAAPPASPLATCLLYIHYIKMQGDNTNAN